MAFHASSQSRLGFTLVELSVVLVIISLLTAGGLAVGAAMVERAAYIDTGKQLRQLDTSLKDYYAVNGHLPCPAAINLMPGDANFGVGVPNCATAGNIAGTVHNGGARSGMIPVRTLGLTDKAASDKFGSRIVYAVTDEMADKTTFGSATGKINIYGIDDATPIQTGMAYVIYSHGRDRKGGYAYSSGVQTGSCGSTTALDEMNCDYANIPKFRDAPFNNGDQEDRFFDDLIRWSPKYQFMAQDTSSSSFWALKDGTDNIYSIGTDNNTTNTNVGIGTDTPAEKLEVAGNVLADSNLISSTGFLGTAYYGGNYMQLSHKDFTGKGQYAILQDKVNGHTFLNTVGNGNLYVRNNNADATIGGIPLLTIRGTDGHAGFGPSGIRSDAMLTVTGGPIYTGAMWLGQSGATNTLPDIHFDQAGLIAAEGHLYLVFDGNNNGSGVFSIRKGRLNNTGPELMRIQNNGNMVVYGDAKTCHIGNGSGNTSCTSDRRYKKDITEVSDALDRLLQIHGVYYRWNDKARFQDKESRFLGVVAQDVQKVFPEAVTTDEDGYLMVGMDALVPPLIESVRILRDRNTALEARVTDLESRIAALEGKSTTPAAPAAKDMRFAWILLLVAAIGILLIRKKK